MEPAPQHILKRERPQIPDVNVVVNRWPTRVHPDRVVLRGQKLFNLLRKGVIQAKGHFGGGNSIVASVDCRAAVSDMLPRWRMDSDYKSGTMHLCVLVIAAAPCSWPTTLAPA